MHHARILEASGSASWKKWAWTPDKHRVFCAVERFASTKRSPRSDLTVKTHMFSKTKSKLFFSD